MLNSTLTNNVDDTNVDEIEEEFKGSNLAGLRRAPKETFVEILPDLWSLEELQWISQAILVFCLG